MSEERGSRRFFSHCSAVALQQTVRPSVSNQMRFSPISLIFGRPVSDAQAQSQKLGAFEGIPAMGLDGLGSAAYGPEAALAILALAGAGGLTALLPLTAIILALLGILWFSYWQAITVFPSSGGSYVVARENLGSLAGLVAAAALMVDYVLNVAVGISAGVGALVSAVPALHPHMLGLCLIILAAITLVNLRGTRESGLLWSLPTYIFVASLGGIVLWSTATLWFSGDPHPVLAPPSPPAAAETMSAWLLLRAFASGCTAMTGVEAVSNGVSAFREPRARYAHATLSAIVLILAGLLAGIAYAARNYGIMAMDQDQPGYQSVLSQLIAAVSGRSAVYYIAMASLLAVLCLSANTSFVGFPRLCHLVACDGYLPRPFAVAGRRLVYSVGVLFLAATSGLLLIVFAGVTNALIPLFAVGAFLAFTIAQAGMAAHWRKTAASELVSRAKLAMNGAGAVATAATLLIMIAAKFVDGAWITVIAIPATVTLLRLVRLYYHAVDSRLLRGAGRAFSIPEERPHVLVPLARWDRLGMKALGYAMMVSDEVTVLHVARLAGPDEDENLERLRRDWQEFVEQPLRAEAKSPPPLRIMRSDSRNVAEPLLQLMEEDDPARPVIIVLPELVEGYWWGRLFHIHRERRLRRRLLRYSGRDVVVLSVPWQLRAEMLQRELAQSQSAFSVLPPPRDR